MSRHPQRRPGKETDDYQLCGQCGSISHESKWDYLKPDDEGGLIPAGPRDEDPIMRCPACGHDHVDDDSGPGLYGGMYEEMERDRLLTLEESPDLAQTWADVLRGAR